MKAKHLTLAILFAGALFSANRATAQVVLSPVFNQLRLEARADFDYEHVDQMGVTSDPYGFHGKYFNLVIGGNLSDKFSYFFRQRIIANPGSSSLFDNTDFLYLNYTPSKNWMFRLGKDALAVGGFEYDAAPIDVLFSTNYWNNFYCFQLAVSAAFKSDDGNQMLLAQVANSPYVYYGGEPWNSGNLSYNLFWSGTFGHFKTLYSANLFDRNDNGHMGYIAMGNKLLYDRWDIYLDIIHHSLSKEDWGKNFAVVSCMNFLLSDDFNIFIKGAYEQNHSEEDFLNLSGTSLDCLVQSGHSYTTYGIGFEYKPSFCKDVRLHGFIANRNDREEDINGNEIGKTTSLNANIGITWHMNIHRMFKERGL